VADVVGREFEMVCKLGTDDVIDPAMNIPFDFRPRDIGGSDPDFSGHVDERIIDVSVQAEGAQGPTLREDLQTELQKIAIEEVPHLYLLHPTIIYGTRDNVQDFAVFPTRLDRFREAWTTG